MKPNEIIVSGKITQDGRLSMFMGELNEFTQKWKGARIIARFSVSMPGTSKSLKAYYFNYVVPTVRVALWEMGDRKTDKQAEVFLRELSPVCWEWEVDTDSGKYYGRLRDLVELSDSELSEHIEFIKQMAAENLNVYVDDPKTI